MRQILSSGFVKAFFLNRSEFIERAKSAAYEAGVFFPHIQEIFLIGSLDRLKKPVSVILISVSLPTVFQPIQSID